MLPMAILAFGIFVLPILGMIIDTYQNNKIRLKKLDLQISKVNK